MAAPSSLTGNTLDELKAIAAVLVGRRDDAICTVMGVEIALDWVLDEMNSRKS